MKIKNNKIVIASLLVAILSSLAFGQAGAQAPQTTKGAVIKGKAPVNKNILKVKLPKATEASLPNGLRVLLLPSRIPTFSMQMVVLSGGLSDPADYRGLATFTAGTLREGTKTRSSKDLAEQVDALGATLTATSSLSGMTSTVAASGLSETLDQTLDLFADVVRNPSFAQVEVDRYKNRLLAQQPFLRANPQFLAGEQFNKAIYGSSHPASLVSAPVDSIKKITPKDLAGFHSTYYRPNNAILAIVSDLSLKELMPKIEKAFGSWEKADVPATIIPQAPPQAAAKIVLIDRPGSVQTVLQLGTLGIERTSPDYFSVLLANRVLGGGPSGRLFLNLREDKGYTYGAYSNFGSSKYRGIWESSAEVRTDVTDGAMNEFMNELKRMRTDKVTADELENAKRAIVGNFALSLEQPQSLLNNIVTQRLYNLPADYWDTYPQKVSAITVDDVQRVAQKYIDLDHLQVVAVGDASKAREVLAKYGKVQVLDVDGKPVAGSAENNR